MKKKSDVGMETLRDEAEEARLPGGGSSAHCAVCGRVFMLTRAGLIRTYGPVDKRYPRFPNPS